MASPPHSVATGDTIEPVTSGAGAYRWYVLALLMVIYAFNFIDRQIVTILAPYLKADLNLTNAQIGLLYGTAFAMFYALLGIPLARLADGWSRVKTLSLGLVFWSAMTCLSGLAGNFAQLGAARLGVGIGEASGSPAAVSLLSDYFPKRIRASIFALYTTGMYVGMGASLMIGGYVVATWPGTWGLAGWQAAFIMVGVPGIALGGLLFLTVREPVRGALDGAPHAGSAHPFRDVLAEAATMFPPWSVGSLRRLGAAPAVVRRNVIAFTGIMVLAAVATIAADGALSPAMRPQLAVFGPLTITSNCVQWFAIGLGVYASVSWLQAVRLRDPAAYALTAGTPAYRAMAACCGLLGVFTYAIGAFAFLYGSTYLDLQPQDGITLGAISAIAGGGGTALGGVLGDMVKRRHPAGRMYLLMIAIVGFAIATLVQFTTTDRQVFFAAYFVALALLTFWPPIMLATAQDLVVPRLRGTGFAVQTLSTSLIGLGLGPYMVGLVSDITGSLRIAILALLILLAPLFALLIRCARLLPGDEASVVRRAQEAGA